MNSFTTRAEKPCVDCKWFRPPHGLSSCRQSRCMHPETWCEDIVWGSTQWNNSPKDLRLIERCCGPGGAWYEPRLMVKVENFLRRELPV